jgi:hypothetical protein
MPFLIPSHWPLPPYLKDCRRSSQLSARRQLNDLPDDLWTKISIEFYKDAADAVFKSLVE